MRKLGPLAAYAEVPEEHARFANFTPVVAKQMHALHAQWNWSSVGPKTMRIGLGFICIIVGLQKLLTLFFVWFISVVASTPPGATVAIYVATGTVRRLTRTQHGISGADACRAGPLVFHSLDGRRALIPGRRGGDHRRLQTAVWVLACSWHCRRSHFCHKGHSRLCTPPFPWRCALLRC